MLKTIIESALGKREAELVLKGGEFVNVFTGEIERGDIAIERGVICGIGDYHGKREIDISGNIVIPGLIDGHVHIESSQLTPEEFAGLVVPRGTTTVIADPHEIVNVCGEAGFKYMTDAARLTPLEVKMQVPSCVPATPFETSGAVIDGAAFAKLIKSSDAFGCGEFMNVPGVIYSDSNALNKIETTKAQGKIVDGHAPAVYGNNLNAYISAGISTDHECVTAEEMRIKLARGLYCHLRHGSTTRNLLENAKAVTKDNLRRVLICTDDRHAPDLRDLGGMDDALRTLVRGGFDPVSAVIAATLNNAECYSLKGKGAIAPGYDADLAVVDNLKDFNALFVYKRGSLVAKDGAPLFEIAKKHIPSTVTATVKIKPITESDLCIRLKGKRAHTIALAESGVVTRDEVKEFRAQGEDIVLDGTDTVKLAVIERHFASGNIGLGLLSGYGLKGGAIALTVAHDSHNLIVAGDNNGDMIGAVNEIERIGGGMAVSCRGKIQSVPLDVGGLMSSLPASEYIKQSEALRQATFALGVKRDLDPFMTLAFLSLLVIPDIKLSDKGLFDVNKFAFIPLDAD